MRITCNGCMAPPGPGKTGKVMKLSAVTTYGGPGCKQEDRLHEAVRKTVMRRCGALPAADDHDESGLIGMVSIGDSCRSLFISPGRLFRFTGISPAPVLL